jgi:hypothetical protein
MSYKVDCMESGAAGLEWFRNPIAEQILNVQEFLRAKE